MFVDEGQDARNSRNKRVREVRIGRLSDNDQQEDSMRNDRRELVRLVANPRIVRHCNPASSGHVAKPGLVCAVVSEVVGVTFYLKPGVAKNGRELQSEVAVGEKDDTQAARSYSTACSTSAVVSP